MAESNARHMSLIPYPASAGDVVLRHGDAVITLDTQSRQLILRDARDDPIDFGQCPYCQRPYQDDHTYQTSPQREHDTPSRQDFVNPDYFRLLADRTPVSAHTTRPPSPSRPPRALRSGQSRQVSSSDPAPSGAEFYGSTPAPRSTDQGIRSSSFLPGYFKQFFVEKRVLGKGGRGVVLLVEHTLDGVNCGDFACKRIPVGNDHDWLTKVLVEVQLLQRLHHPNLVAYQHVWLEDAQTTKFGPIVPCVFILQQFCNAGDLHDYVQNAGSRSKGGRKQSRSDSLATIRPQPFGPSQLSPAEIFSFFKDIVAGIDHLHACGYIHRDLKPSNCLLNRDGNKMTVLVSDFGEVQVATAQRSSTGATGTISYCAPEVLQRETPDGSYGNFTVKSDVFSLGMILHYICFGTLPYVHADIKEENEDLDMLRTEIISWQGFRDPANRRDDLPDQLYIFLERLLSIDPANRPTTSEILQSLKHGIGTQDNPGSQRVEIVEDGGSSGEEMPYRSAGPPQRLPQRRPSQSAQRRNSSFGNMANPESQPRRTSFGATTRPRFGSPPALRRHGDLDTLQDTFIESAIASHDDKHGHSRKDSARAGHDHQISTGGNAPRRPLLLLPPSEQAQPASFRAMFPTPSQAIRMLLFMLKAASLMFMCTPYSASPVPALTLLGLATVDLISSTPAWPRSAALFAGHILAILLLHRNSSLCARTGRDGQWWLSSRADNGEL